MKKPLQNTFRRFYELYASDLSLSEIERLIKRDAPGVYDFYLREVEKTNQKPDSFSRVLKLIANLFIAFLRKLTPSRRVLYSLILLFFIAGLVSGRWFWATIAFLLLNVLLAFELADKLTAKDELEVAREIQMGLMPKEAPSTIGFDIACFSETALEVGGDYYDFIQPPKSRDTTFLVIGDVSGKGMGAALHMVQVQAILHNLAEQHKKPRDILLALNQNLQHVLRNGSFFTITIASFNAEKTLHVCRAGHMPLIHHRKNSGACAEIVPPGIGIGLPFKGQFAESLEEIEVPVEPGDVFFFYTDGVVETMNSAKKEFGEERMKNLITENAHKPAAAIKDALLSALARFRGPNPPHDDLTLVVLKAV
jgi:serine phosphatase RsbU (regulator of sigma subunit)